MTRRQTPAVWIEKEGICVHSCGSAQSLALYPRKLSGFRYDVNQCDSTQDKKAVFLSSGMEMKGFVRTTHAQSPVLYLWKRGGFWYGANMSGGVCSMWSLLMRQYANMNTYDNQAESYCRPR